MEVQGRSSIVGGRRILKCGMQKWTIALISMLAAMSFISVLCLPLPDVQSHYLVELKDSKTSRVPTSLTYVVAEGSVEITWNPQAFYPSEYVDLFILMGTPSVSHTSQVRKLLAAENAEWDQKVVVEKREALGATPKPTGEAKPIVIDVSSMLFPFPLEGQTGLHNAKVAPDVGNLRGSLSDGEETGSQPLLEKLVKGMADAQQRLSETTSQWLSENLHGAASAQEATATVEATFPAPPVGPTEAEVKLDDVLSTSSGQPDAGRSTEKDKEFDDDFWGKSFVPFHFTPMNMFDGTTTDVNMSASDIAETFNTLSYRVIAENDGSFIYKIPKSIKRPEQKPENSTIGPLGSFMPSWHSPTSAIYLAVVSSMKEIWRPNEVTGRSGIMYAIDAPELGSKEIVLASPISRLYADQQKSGDVTEGQIVPVVWKTADYYAGDMLIELFAIDPLTSVTEVLGRAQSSNSGHVNLAFKQDSCIGEYYLKLSQVHFPNGFVYSPRFRVAPSDLVDTTYEPMMPAPSKDVCRLMTSIDRSLPSKSGVAAMSGMQFGIIVSCGFVGIGILVLLLIFFLRRKFCARCFACCFLPCQSSGNTTESSVSAFGSDLLQQSECNGKANGSVKLGSCVNLESLHELETAAGHCSQGNSAQMSNDYASPLSAENCQRSTQMSSLEVKSAATLAVNTPNHEVHHNPSLFHKESHHMRVRCPISAETYQSDVSIAMHAPCEKEHFQQSDDASPDTKPSPLFYTTYPYNYQETPVLPHLMTGALSNAYYQHQMFSARKSVGALCRNEAGVACGNALRSQPQTEQVAVVTKQKHHSPSHLCVTPSQYDDNTGKSTRSVASLWNEMATEKPSNETFARINSHMLPNARGGKYSKKCDQEPIVLHLPSSEAGLVVQNTRCQKKESCRHRQVSHGTGRRARAAPSSDTEGSDARDTLTHLPVAPEFPSLHGVLRVENNNLCSQTRRTSVHVDNDESFHAMP